jgi:choline dehydrogenase
VPSGPLESKESNVAYDYVVVGAGSSGSVLAARLTEQSDRTVLLLEAGLAHSEPGADDLYDLTFALGAHDWGLTARAVGERTVPYPQGKVAGGGSAVNGALALRGMPADYDGWAALGNREWAWAKLLPCFSRLEDDPQGDLEFHGREGPLPISRWTSEQLAPVQEAFRASCEVRGIPSCDDLNHPQASGVGPWPMNRRGMRRISTNLGYLQPAGGRPNLKVEPNAHVTRVLLDGGRAIGVEFEQAGEMKQAFAGEVVLSAGALQSPGVLWRTGIGPADELRRIGVECLLDLPGVGANLMEHVGTFLFLLPADGACRTDVPQYQLGVRWTSSGSQDENDLILGLMSYWDLTTVPDLHALVGTPLVFAMSAGIQLPAARGRVSWGSADHRAAPTVDLNLCGAAEDRRTLAAGLRLCWEIADTPPLSEFVAGPALLDRAAFDDDLALEHYVTGLATPWFHPAGTCRMGPESDPGAVVDEYCRVRGVEALRVVDASIMPTIPRANINLTCVAIGERAVELINGVKAGAPGGALEAG